MCVVGRMGTADIFENLHRWYVAPYHTLVSRDVGGRDSQTCVSRGMRRSHVATENKDQELETASVTLAEGMHFAGAIDGFHIDLDAEEYAGGTGAGPQPHRLLLLALAGCTAMDVVSILRKKRQQVSGLRVEVQGSRVDQHPRVYTRFEVLYRVRGTTIDPRAVERAIELSTSRYCPVINLLGKVAPVTTRYEIEEEAMC